MATRKQRAHEQHVEGNCLDGDHVSIRATSALLEVTKSETSLQGQWPALLEKGVGKQTFQRAEHRCWWLEIDPGPIWKSCTTSDVPSEAETPRGSRSRYCHDSRIVRAILSRRAKAIQRHWAWILGPSERVRASLQRPYYVQPLLEVRRHHAGNGSWLLRPYSYGVKRYLDSSMVQDDGTVVFDIRLKANKLP